MTPNLSSIGWVLLALGVALVLVGAVAIVAGRAGLPFGQLPGDITAQRGPVTIFAPLASCLVISLLLTIAVNVLIWLARR